MAAFMVGSMSYPMGKNTHCVSVCRAAMKYLGWPCITTLWASPAQAHGGANEGQPTDRGWTMVVWLLGWHTATEHETQRLPIAFTSFRTTGRSSMSALAIATF